MAGSIAKSTQGLVAVEQKHAALAKRAQAFASSKSTLAIEANASLARVSCSRSCTARFLESYHLADCPKECLSRTLFQDSVVLGSIITNVASMHTQALAAIGKATVAVEAAAAAAGSSKQGNTSGSLKCDSKEQWARVSLSVPWRACRWVLIGRQIEAPVWSAGQEEFWLQVRRRLLAQHFEIGLGEGRSGRA